MSYLYSTPAKDDKTPLTNKTAPSRVVGIDSTPTGLMHNDGKVLNKIEEAGNNLREITPQPTDRSNLLYYPYSNPNTNVCIISY